MVNLVLSNLANLLTNSRKAIVVLLALESRSNKNNDIIEMLTVRSLMSHIPSNELKYTRLENTGNEKLKIEPFFAAILS